MKREFKVFHLFTRFLAIILAVLSLGASARNEIHGASGGDIYGTVLRLHILSNSDKNEDITEKYALRDAILPAVTKIFSSCKTRDEAVKVAQNNAALLQQIAQKELKKLGSSHTAAVKIGEKYYETRVLHGKVFPAGSYLSVQIIIGDGEGQNWWGLLFPKFFNIGVDTSEDGVMLGGVLQHKEQKKAQNRAFSIFGTKITFKFFSFFN